MPYKNGKFVRHGRTMCIQPPADEPKTENVQDNKILAKIQESKKEELNEDQKKERLKKFVSFKITM